MKSFTAATLLTLLVSTVSGQASNGCDENYSGTFEIAPYNITDNIPPQVETVCTTNPIVSLKDGVLTDQNKRTGEVVANHQFQFDSPVQGPTTSGFSICSNGSLALNGKAIWYGCLSGGFSNLYDIAIGGQCHLVYIVTYPCSGSGASAIASSPSSTSSSSSSTSSSTSSSSTMTTSTVPTPVVPATTSTTSTSSTPVASPATSAPFPVGNSTTTSATATGATTTSATTSPTPASFKGAANVVAVGGKIVAVIAAAAAFALF